MGRLGRKVKYRDAAARQTPEGHCLTVMERACGGKSGFVDYFMLVGV